MTTTVMVETASEAAATAAAQTALMVHAMATDTADGGTTAAEIKEEREKGRNNRKRAAE